MKIKICLSVLMIFSVVILVKSGFCQDPHRYNSDGRNGEYGDSDRDDRRDNRNKRTKRPRRARTDETGRRYYDDEEPVEEKKEPEPVKSEKKKGKYPYNRTYSIGIKGGMVISYVNSDEFAIDHGVDGAVFLSNEVYFYNLFSIEIDFGYHVSSFNSGRNYYAIEYFSIPLFVKLYYSRFFMDPNMLEMWLGAGLEFRFRTGDNGFGNSTMSEEDNTGVLLCFGFKKPIYKDLKMTLEFRFYIGLDPAVKTEWDEEAVLREINIFFGLSYDLF